MRTNERRLRLWLIVFRRKKVSVQELADELEVCARTIRYDLAYMIGFYPIETVRGKYTGCVKLEDRNIRLNESLTDEQIDFLLNIWSGLQGKDARMMWDIITVLTLPK